jgi:hypothetical protein
MDSDIMSQQDDIKKLITYHTRRLQKLKEQKALEGRSVDPKILIEIEDIDTEIKNLQIQLEEISRGGKKSSQRIHKSLQEQLREFENDYQQTAQKVQKLQSEAEHLYLRDPVNNEVQAIGKLREAYELATRLVYLFPSKTEAQSLADDAKGLYESSKQQWTLALTTLVSMGKFDRVKKEWKRAKEVGETMVMAFTFPSYDTAEDTFLVAQRGLVPIDEALQLLDDAILEYADNKTAQYLERANAQVVAGLKIAVDMLEGFLTNYNNLLGPNHKESLKLKLKIYQSWLEEI